MNVKHPEEIYSKLRTVSLLFIYFLSYGPLNIENIHLSHIFMSTLFKKD